MVTARKNYLSNRSNHEKSLFFKTISLHFIKVLCRWIEHLCNLLNLKFKFIKLSLIFIKRHSTVTNQVNLKKWARKKEKTKIN